MRGSGSYDAGRVNARQQFRGLLGKIRNPKLFSDFLGLTWRVVKDTLEDYTIKLCVDTRVVFSKVADSGYENPNGFVFSGSSG